MIKYIDRKAASNAISSIDTSRPSDDKDDIVEQAIGLIDHLPTADVAEVKHGYWKNCGAWGDMGDVRYKCTVCGDATFNSDMFEYCPHCGAKMDSKI